MMIGILQTGSVRQDLLDRFENYPAMFQTLLRNIDPTLQFKVYDVQQDHYPNNVNECDSYITTGSKSSVYDQQGWIEKLGKYIMELNRQNKKLVAVCFGHQLVAQVFGGKTEKAGKGWGVGVHTMEVYTTKSWMKPVLETCNVLVSHQDQVTVLPPDAELIAGNSFCPFSMFQLGDNILTVQGHPEFNKQYAKTLMHERANLIGDEKYKNGIKSLRKPTDELSIANWMIQFLRS